MRTSLRPRPWREVALPHADIASGRASQADFAADLAQVCRGAREGGGGDEYHDPAEFFRRTFLTQGMRELLGDALLRLSGRGGEPVIELQTEFGGGKTHALLALYHLFGSAPGASLAGIEPLLREAGLVAIPSARRAVLVGHELSPAEVHTEPDGTRVRTLWGHMAWQLGGEEGYALVAGPDARGISPGVAALGELFRRYSPCLVLVDEWVAYARQLVGKRELPGGDFAAQATFAQALTEAAKASARTLVVTSLPASPLEAGGERGELALETLRKILARVGKPWRPPSEIEEFQIAKRRLFATDLEGDAAASARRAEAVEAFLALYRAAPDDFPAHCAEESYRRALEAAYPLHPELLRELHRDWSTLPRFQRTRAVLRLLAKVIHRLWEDGDTGIAILPASVPLDDGAVRAELTRALPDVWEPVLAQDVEALPAELDRRAPKLGRASVTRRVARALFLGTAPGAGIDARRVRLGCAQPGDAAALFDDALRRLSDRARYIHQDGDLHSISTQPNLNRLAEGRAQGLQRDPEPLFAEVVRRLHAESRSRGDFAAVHPCPESSAEVPDEPAARLVLLSPRHPHRKGAEDSAALAMAAEILTRKGNGPRLAQNCLVFLAPDERELEALLQATALHLAWRSIHEERARLHLAPLQQRRAQSRTEESDETVERRLRATWIHALVPTQPDPEAAVRWEELKIGGSEPLAPRTSARLAREEMLLLQLGARRLRMELDRHLWAGTEQVSAGQLAEWFARHLYLPRLANEETLFRAIREGAAQPVAADAFAVEAGWDEAAERHRVDRATLVMKPRPARDREPAPAPPQEPAPALQPNLFVGSVPLNPARIGRDAGRIAEEVLEHLSALPGAEVEVVMQIRIKIPDGVKDDVARTVTENARTLKFTAQSFERE